MGAKAAEQPALFGKTRQQVLALFLSHPDEAFYLRQAARLLGAGQGAVQRELKALTEAGILARLPRGSQVYYQANRQSPIFPELQSLMVKTAGVADVLRMALAPLAPRIAVAFVYGSVASGTAVSDSDVDVMVVGDASFREVVDALAATPDRLRREVNPSVYPQQEFAQKVEGANHFLCDVLRKPKVFLIGDEHELARLAKKRLAR